MIPNNDQGVERSLILFVSAGVFAVLVGLTVLTGWFFNISFLEVIVPGFATMKFNTALSFVMAGADFILLVKYKTSWARNLFRLLAAALGILALLTISQDVFHYSLGLDQFFVTDAQSIAIHYPYPGRMSPATSLSFLFLAIGFLGIDSNSLAFKKTAQYLLHFITTIAFIMMTGYLLKVPYTNKINVFSLMAIHTAAVMFILSIAAASINYNLGITSLFMGLGVGNIIARRLFPRMVIFLVVIGYCSIMLQRANFITPEFGFIISTVVFLIIMLFLMWDTLTQMNRLDQNRTDAEYETLQLARNLETIVAKRTLALKHSNERFLKIFNANPTAIAITNIETGKYVDLNPAIIELLGYNRDEIIDHTAAGLNIITSEFREKMVEALATKGYIRKEDVILKGKDGEDRHCILSAEMLEDEDGKYMMSFVYDITNRKIMENNLLEVKDRLEVMSDKLIKQNKQLLSFAHIISHNLRSPVSNLNLLMHFYKDSKTPEDKAELWGNFEIVIGHLNTTLDELLETLKIQEDTGREREKLCFDKIFDDARAILIGQVIESQAVITTDFKVKEVLYPKIYLESIMLNLISNAIKYRSPNRVPEIHVASQNKNGEIVLTIQDNGLGIDMKRHSKNLFGLRKTFHRHSEAKGLGLFITKTQIEAMGGEISAESEVDKGTKFTVVFNKS